MAQVLAVQELAEIPKTALLLITTPTGERIVSDHKKTRAWIEKYHPDWTVKLVPLFAGPQGVHIALRGMTLCDLSHNRKDKWGMSFDDAFDLVDEEPTCPTCIARGRGVQGKLVTAVLKPWDWANIHEDYRPGGRKYYGGRQ
jgi:hypothetical protein